MKFKYIGPQEGVDIPALGIVVDHGETVEITGDIAEEFLKRDDWVRVDRPKSDKGDSK